jgi:VanZ family protein
VAQTLFQEHAPYRKAALAAAIVWTIGIFVACLWPGKELPHSDIPFIDKWTHLILFGGFAVLWLCAYPSRRIGRLLLIFVIATALGILVECLQIWLPKLGRSGEVMDAVADAAGGALGAIGFWCAGRLRAK